MTFKRKIIKTIYIFILLIVSFGGYLGFRIKMRKDYYKAQEIFYAEMKQTFEVGDYIKCVATMEKSIRLKKEKTTSRETWLSGIVDNRVGDSGISYFYTTLYYYAWDNTAQNLSGKVNRFLQEAPDFRHSERKFNQQIPWYQLGKAMADSEMLHLQLLGLWLTRDDVEMAKVLFSRIDRGEVGITCYMALTVLHGLEGVSPEDKFNYYVKAFALDYPKPKEAESRVMILERMQHTKCLAVSLSIDAIKNGMSKIGASEKIIEAMKRCWGGEYPEETRYFYSHLDSYISGQDNYEPIINAWLKANPN